MGDADELLRNFVLLVSEKGRAGEIEEIYRELDALVAAEQKRLTVELTTAYELSDEEAASILKKIEQSSGRTGRGDPQGRSRADRRHRAPGRLAARRREREGPHSTDCATNSRQGAETREATPRRDHLDPQVPDRGLRRPRPTSPRSAPCSRSETASPACTASRTASRSSGSSSSTASSGSRSTWRRTTSGWRSSASGRRSRRASRSSGPARSSTCPSARACSAASSTRSATPSTAPARSSRPSAARSSSRPPA